MAASRVSCSAQILDGDCPPTDDEVRFAVGEEAVVWAWGQGPKQSERRQLSVGHSPPFDQNA